MVDPAQASDGVGAYVGVLITCSALKRLEESVVRELFG